MEKLDNSAPRFSLIIPAYNEEAYLPVLLKSVQKARARYTDGPEEIEIVVADNASTDATADVARSNGCRVVLENRRIIAAVRNAGSARASCVACATTPPESIRRPVT